MSGTTTEAAAETCSDNVFTIPAGHQGVPFISAAGGMSGPIVPLTGVTPNGDGGNTPVSEGHSAARNARKVILIRRPTHRNATRTHLTTISMAQPAPSSLLSHAVDHLLAQDEGLLAALDGSANQNGLIGATNGQKRRKC
jgi:hypothetical protein